jgi:hypothetical protein
MTTQPETLRNLTPEQKKRQASGNTSAKGKKARAASPWNKGPMCGSFSAGLSYLQLKRKPK